MVAACASTEPGSTTAEVTQPNPNEVTVGGPCELTTTGAPQGDAGTREATSAGVEAIVFVGDSISLELFHAARQRSADRDGPEIRHLNVRTPTECANWEELLNLAIGEAETTAVVMAVGFWFEVPADAGRSTQELTAELAGWLAPVASDQLAAPTKIVALHSVDDPAGNARIQEAKSLLVAAADQLGIEVIETLPGVLADGTRAYLTVENLDFPIRDGNDVVHHCAMAALALADALLDALGVPTRAVTVADLIQLRDMAATEDLPGFDGQGCTALDPTTTSQ